jgi:hypothetical protein
MALNSFYAVTHSRSVLDGILEGVDMISETIGKHKGQQLGGLFQIAAAMCDAFYRHVYGDVTALKLRSCEHIVRRYRPFFRQYLRPVRWRVQECRIPGALKRRGVMVFLQPWTALPARSLGRWFVVDAFVHKEGGGAYYVL